MRGGGGMNAQAPNTGLSQFSNLQFFYSNILSLIEHSEIYLTTNLGVHLNPNFRDQGYYNYNNLVIIFLYKIKYMKN